jgi:hypothetical protein
MVQYLFLLSTKHTLEESQTANWSKFHETKLTYNKRREEEYFKTMAIIEGGANDEHDQFDY